MDYNYQPQLIVISILLLTTLFFVYTRSFTNDVPTCNGYITNVYLYFILGLLLIYFSILVIDKKRFPITSTKSLLFMAIAIGCIFGIYMTDPKSVLITHLLWLVFIIALSVNLYTIWRSVQYRGLLTSTLIITLVLFSVMTTVAFLKPEWINLNWGSFLTLALFAGLLASIVPLFLKTPTKGYYRVLSVFFVILFMALILYDTKLLRYKAENCTFPDYPKDSLGLILDSVNLFSFSSGSFGSF